MAYRLKSIKYSNRWHHILLQNENGPCPLLAAANVLLIRKSIVLPSKCVESGVVTIEELTNILAGKILTNNHHSRGNDFHIDEVMKIFPKLQFGLDVNVSFGSDSGMFIAVEKSRQFCCCCEPKFTAGPTGLEYTMELNAFDLLQIELVHGWLLDSNAQEFEWVADNTYNQLVDLVIEGNDASAKLQQNSDVDDCQYDELSNQATRGTIIRNFLDRSAHQLTQHGLFVLHDYIKEGDVVVFFRNNHYNTLTKYKENLYLLVTDFGYADVNSVVWEKLDVIDGDTEYVTGEFKVPPVMKYHMSTLATGEQLISNNAQSQTDFHLALQLNRYSNKPSGVTAAGIAPKTKKTNIEQQESDVERAKHASLLEYQREQKEKSKFEEGSTDFKPPAITSISKSPSRQNATCFPTIAVGVPVLKVSQEERDSMLAMQLQREEEKRMERVQHQINGKFPPRLNAAAKDSNCVIS